MPSVLEAQGWGHLRTLPEKAIDNGTDVEPQTWCPGGQAETRTVKGWDRKLHVPLQSKPDPALHHRSHPHLTPLTSLLPRGLLARSTILNVILVTWKREAALSLKAVQLPTLP